MNATERQIEALASLQSAILSQEENLIETVEFVVKEAGDARERATEAYRYHLRTTGAQVRNRRLNRALEDSGN